VSRPDIVDVQVIGVPDERYGEEIMAWVNVRDVATLSVDDARDFCPAGSRSTACARSRSSSSTWGPRPRS
jgi:acyl-CoA synthetase (AMP-forming)/AMP-acid ligase II